MNVKASLQSYEEVEFSITMTAPVEDWRALVRQIEKLNGSSRLCAWPLSGVLNCIQSTLSDLDRTHAGSVAKDSTLTSPVETP